MRRTVAELAAREKGVIQADTLAQAQAQLVQIVRRLTNAQRPPIEIRSVEIGQARLLGEQYGEIWVPMSFECRIEQLVNERLQEIMVESFAAVVEYADKHGVNNRTAAYMVALDRVAAAIKLRGIYA